MPSGQEAASPEGAMSSLGGGLCKVPCQRRVLIGHNFKPSREIRPLAGG